MGAQTLDDFFIGEAGTLGWLLRAAETGGALNYSFSGEHGFFGLYGC